MVFGNFATDFNALCTSWFYSHFVTDQCTVTKSYLFLHKFWFFSTIYYFGNWAFLAVSTVYDAYFLSMVYPGFLVITKVKTLTLTNVR